MEKIVITILTFFLSSEVYCQPVVTDAGNKQIMMWDSSYQVDTKSFRADSNYEIPYQYVVKKSERVIAEYFRHDGTSYLYVGYDTSGRRLQRGLLKYCSEVLDSFKIQIQDWKLDPDGSKGITYDTIVYDYSLRKNGVWWEKDIYGMIWKGEYKNGSREGEWKEGVIVCCNIAPTRINDALYDLLRPYLTHNFKTGIEISLYKDSVFWPKITGGWIEYKLSANTVIWEREKRLFKYQFKNDKVAMLYKRPQYPKDHINIEKTAMKWEQDEDQIKLFDNGKQTILRILKFTDNQMIFRIVRQDL